MQLVRNDVFVTGTQTLIDVCIKLAGSLQALVLQGWAPATLNIH